MIEAARLAMNLKLATEAVRLLAGLAARNVIGADFSPLYGRDWILRSPLRLHDALSMTERRYHHCIYGTEDVLLCRLRLKVGTVTI